jgi:hypothetical protein
VVQDTLKTAADSFLFFLVYNSLRQTRLQARQRKHHLPVLDELGVGFIAGATAKLFTMPMSAIVTRLQTASVAKSKADDAPTTISIAKQIRAEKGILGFWSGYSATLVLTLNPSLTFFFFEKLKRILPQSKRNNPGLLATFFLAAISKALASTITYPFSLAKARIQASSKSVNTPETDNAEKPGANASTRRSEQALQRTVLGTILEIARTEGLSALYEGLQGEVLKGFFNHGITMLMKDAIHSLILRTYFALLRLLKKYPTPETLTELAQQRAQNAIIYTQEVASDAVDNAQQQGKRLFHKVEHVATRTGNILVEEAQEMGEFVKEYVGNGEDESE